MDLLSASLSGEVVKCRQVNVMGNCECYITVGEKEKTGVLASGHMYHGRKMFVVGCVTNSNFSELLIYTLFTIFLEVASPK